MGSRRMLCTVLFFLALAMLPACTSSGSSSLNDENRQTISEKIQQGVTTREEVSAMLGDPTTAEAISNGQEIWTYEATRITPLMRNYIPYVSILSSGSDIVELTLTIRFDDKGVVHQYNWFEAITLRRSSIFTRR